jgi:hypothetical protein
MNPLGQTPLTRKQRRVPQLSIFATWDTAEADRMD